MTGGNGIVLFITTVAIYNQNVETCVSYNQEILWCTLNLHHPLNSYATEVDPWDQLSTWLLNYGMRPILAKNQFSPPYSLWCLIVIFWCTGNMRRICIWQELILCQSVHCKIIQSCLNTISLVVFSELELFFIGLYSFSHLSHSWNIDIEKSERFDAKYNVPFCRRTLLTKIRVVLQCWKTERKSRLITK